MVFAVIIYDVNSVHLSGPTAEVVIDEWHATPAIISYRSHRTQLYSRVGHFVKHSIFHKDANLLIFTYQITKKNAFLWILAKKSQTGIVQCANFFAVPCAETVID